MPMARDTAKTRLGEKLSVDVSLWYKLLPATFVILPAKRDAQLRRKLNYSTLISANVN